MVNMESIGILGVLGTSLDKMGHGSVRIVIIRGLGKVYLILYKMIS